MIEAGLYDALKADADVYALVSARIYPMQAPSGVAMPYITYQRISSNRANVMVNAAGYSETTIQVTCWDDDYAGVKNLADKVRIAIDATTGTWNSRQVDGIEIMGENDLINHSPETTEHRLFGVALDFTIWHQEPTS